MDYVLSNACFYHLFSSFIGQLPLPLTWCYTTTQSMGYSCYEFDTNVILKYHSTPSPRHVVWLSMLPTAFCIFPLVKKESISRQIDDKVTSSLFQSVVVF